MIGCLLVGRTELLSKIDEKMSILRETEYQTYDVMKSFSKLVVPLDSHREIDYVQTKMMIVQVLFDVYKVIMIELHRKMDKDSINNFFPVVHPVRTGF